MKKKATKYKIAQNGTSNTEALAWGNAPSLNPQQPNTAPAFTFDANGNAVDSKTGQVYYKQDPTQSNNPSLNLTNTQFGTEKVKTNTFDLSPAFKKLNAAMDVTTAIGKMSNNNNSREKQMYLDAIQPRAYNNKDEDGLNNIPTYFKMGGNNTISASKAKEILKDGKANGKKLTAKQKKYFGYVMQTGGFNFITSNDLKQPSPEISANSVDARGVSPDYINDPINAGRQRLPYKYDYKLPDDSYYNEPVTGNNYGYQGVMLNGESIKNLTKGKAIQANTDYFMNNNPSSNVYRHENQHHSSNFDRKTLDNLTFMQNGGMPTQPILAEAGEIYKDTSGALNKIPDHMDDHDDRSGGVELENVAQVLEDTGDKRDDMDSKLLLINPKEMLNISGLSTKKPITHSKAFELMSKDAQKNSDYVQKFLKKNVKSLKASPNDIYAKNSLDMNVDQLNNVPTQADIFNKLFEHQEAIKSKYQIDQETAKAQNGLDNDPFVVRLKYLDSQRAKQALGHKVDNPALDYNQEYMDMLQSASRDALGNESDADPYIARLQYLDSQRAKQALGNEVDDPNFDYDAAYNSMLQTASRDALGHNPQVGTNRGSGKYSVPQGNGIFAYQGDKNNKSNASHYTDAQWRQFAKDAGFTGKNNRDFQTFLFNMNGERGGIDLQSGIIDLHNKFGNPNTPPSGKSMYNWLDGRLGHRWDKAYEDFYAKNAPQGSPINPSDFFDGAPTDTPSSVNTSTPPPITVPSLGTIGSAQPKNDFNAPLKWYDTAASTYGLIDSLGRHGVKYDGIDLTAPKAKYQNPLPVLQQGQADYNAMLDILPQNGVGYANAANVFGKKYALNDQVLGQYENINNNIWNANEQATVSTKNAQSQYDQQARQLFEQKQLQGIEAQRQQFFQSLKDATGTIAANAKYNREGNLLMKLFPAFSQKGDYNGYKYNFYNPGRTAPYVAPTTETTKKTTKNNKIT